MLQNLAKCACTRRATTSLVFGSTLPTAYVQKRFYAPGKNQEIVTYLQQCEEKERDSRASNTYRIQSFRLAADVVEKLDFTVKHGDDLKGVRGIGPGIRSRINMFLGHEKLKPLGDSDAIKALTVIPGLGERLAETLYNAGCTTIQDLHLKKYKDALSHNALMGLKYFEHTRQPVQRESPEAIVDFCKRFLSMDGYEIVIAGEYRRGASNLTEPIELVIIDKNYSDPIPTPPHPSTLEPLGPRKSSRSKQPFSRHYEKKKQRATSVLLTKFADPLNELGLVSDTTNRTRNLWQGWMRVPKRGESRKTRLEGVHDMSGEFHRVNVAYVPKASKGAALLVLTGDDYYHLDCQRKAIDAGLYLNEWGLWEWEPSPESISRFQTSDAPHVKNSLGAMWGSETEQDEGRWVRPEVVEEEQILDAIGVEYVPPHKRNFRFLVGGKSRNGSSATTKNP